MAYNDLVKEQFNDINDLATLLNSMVNSYRLLIGGAGELNNINDAKKSEVRDAVKRADDLGDIIDHMIKIMDECTPSYTRCCKIKKSFYDEKIKKDNIFTEIDYELNLNNSEGGKRD